MDLSRTIPCRIRDKAGNWLGLFEPFARRPQTHARICDEENLLTFDLVPSVLEFGWVVDFRHFRKITEPEAHTFDFFVREMARAQRNLETAFGRSVD